MSQRTHFGRKRCPCWFIFVALRGKCIHENVCVDDFLKDSYSSEGEVATAFIAQSSSALDVEAGSERRIICIGTFLVTMGAQPLPICVFLATRLLFQILLFCF